MGNHLVISDVHYPYQSDSAFRGLRRELRGVRVDVVHVLGDYFDCGAFSEYVVGLKDVCDGVGVFSSGFRYLRGFVGGVGADRVVYYIGNHEERFERHVRRVSVVLDGVVRFSDFVPSWCEYVGGRDGRVWGGLGGVSGLRLLHGGVVRLVAGAASLELLRRYSEGGVVMGHTHRLGQVWHCDRVGVECGCMCDDSMMEYLRVRPIWTRGAVLIDRRSVRLIHLG